MDRLCAYRLWVHRLGARNVLFLDALGEFPGVALHVIGAAVAVEAA